MIRSIQSKLLISLAIAAMAVQVNTVPLYYLLFSLNQTEIARTLCEKKQAGCDGHCFLKKQIAKSHDASPNARQNESFESLLNINFLVSSSDQLASPEISKNNQPRYFSGSLASGWPSSILQPPREQL